MKRVATTCFLVLTALFGFCVIINAQNDNPAEQDKKAIDSCIKNLYNYLSYVNGKMEGVDSIASLFIQDAKLVANFGRQPQTWLVPQFIVFIKDGYSKQSITDREETELFEKTEIFGNIAQRFSTYKISFTVNRKIDQRRGINGIQLLKINGKWLINSLVWDIERSPLKLPGMYLRQ
jgi:hypothetical protein